MHMQWTAFLTEFLFFFPLLSFRYMIFRTCALLFKGAIAKRVQPDIEIAVEPAGLNLEPGHQLRTPASVRGGGGFSWLQLNLTGTMKLQGEGKAQFHVLRRAPVKFLSNSRMSLVSHKKKKKGNQSLQVSLIKVTARRGRQVL